VCVCVCVLYCTVYYCCGASYATVVYARRVGKDRGADTPWSSKATR